MSLQQGRKKNMHNIAVIDIGGTAIKYGLMTPEGTLKQQGSMPTKAREDGADGIVEKVIGIVKEYQQHFYVDAVGIDTAGIVKPGQDGEIVFAGGESFPGYSGTRLGKLVREATGLPCVVENDVNAAAIGEYTQGAARGAKSAFVMTVGTGIGGCLILDGKIWHGASYSAGEAGFMRVHGDQRIFEEIASTRAMLQEAAYTHNVSPAELTGEQVFAWARRGDADAQAAIVHFAQNLSEGIANICCLLNPEIIVLGGGIMAQRQMLAPLITREVERLVPEAMRKNTRIDYALLGNTAGMIGVGQLARQLQILADGNVTK